MMFGGQYIVLCRDIERQSKRLLFSPADASFPPSLALLLFYGKPSERRVQLLHRKLYKAGVNPHFHFVWLHRLKMCGLDQGRALS